MSSMFVVIEKHISTSTSSDRELWGPALNNYPDKLQCLLMCDPWITQVILHFNLYIEIFDYGISNFLLVSRFLIISLQACQFFT